MLFTMKLLHGTTVALRTAPNDNDTLDKEVCKMYKKKFCNITVTNFKLLRIATEKHNIRNVCHRDITITSTVKDLLIPNNILLTKE